MTPDNRTYYERVAIIHHDFKEKPIQEMILLESFGVNHVEIGWFDIPKTKVVFQGYTFVGTGALYALGICVQLHGSMPSIQ